MTYKITITEGGTREEMEEIWALCRYSNDLARAAYGFLFFDLCRSNSQFAASVDILPMTVDGRATPVLREGSNRYSTLSQSNLLLTESVNTSLKVDAFVIIPELQRLILRPSSDKGIRSALSVIDLAQSLRILDPTDMLETRLERTEEIRVFDSHPSLGTYINCFRSLLDFLGVGPVSFEFDVALKDYICDLAGRFSDVKTKSIFPTEGYLVKEFPQDPGRNTGIHRYFENSSAPIQSSLLLIGDSHSYSVLSKLCSNVFREVHFFWASRRNDYAPFRQLVDEAAASSNFVVEEVSERFFLSNFCAVQPSLA